MISELHKTKANIVGLIEILGKHLYSTPTVAIRELIQNAYDSCIRRQIESQEPFEPKIKVKTNSAEGILIIEDNGAGLTKEEIINFVATIGSGYTRSLRGNADNNELIGYFGLGFLTAYSIASRIELTTTSYREKDKAWKFISTTPERFNINEYEAREVGLKITIQLDNKYLDFADEYIMSEIISHYCCLLKIPVFLNDNLLERIIPPWEYNDNEISSLRKNKIRLEFAKNFEQSFEPICTIPVYSSAECDVNGLLWIHDSRTYNTSDNRKVSVFIRGMLVGDNEIDLLPSWAGFVSATIESKTLLPTLSREDIQKDENYFKIQSHLKETLIEGIYNIVKEDTEKWRLIIRRHNEALLGSALSDDRLFQIMADDLMVPTSEGDMTIKNVLYRTKNKIHATLSERGGYEEIIFRSLKQPVVLGYRYAALSFCNKYGNTYNKPIIVLGSKEGESLFFKKIEITDEKIQILKELFFEEHIEIISTKFHPSYLPIVIIPDRDYQLKTRIESDEADRRITTAALSLARKYTNKLNGKTACRLYINLESPIINKIFTIDDDSKKQLSILLRSLTYLIASHNETDFPIDIVKEFKIFNETLTEIF
jgi:molecular chaperone HtpG